jgi:transcriptional regulator with XRE-family HTH domain
MREPAPVAEAFAAVLLKARKAAGMTQEELADLSGLDRTTISQVERGKGAPRVETLIRLAGALDVDPGDLLPELSWEPTPPSSPSPKGRFRMGSRKGR